MKIAYITKYFHPLKGGAEQNILNLARQAVADGHEVTVITSNKKDNQKLPAGTELFEGMTIIRVATWFDLSLYLAFYPGLFFKLLKGDFDVVHASGFGLIWQDFCLITKKLFAPKTTFINTPHGPFMALKTYSLPLRIVKTIYTWKQKFFLNWLYDAVIQVNTFQWQWIVEYGVRKEKVHFVPNGIGDDVIKMTVAQEQVSDFVQKYQLESKQIIASLGRVDKYKGLQDVIKVLPTILKKYPHTQYLIMGRDDGYLMQLQQLVSTLNLQNNVIFISEINDEEKLVALKASEIFILPSEWEAFGIVMLEAMTQENALISTTTEGGKFLIQDNVNGLLYNFGDHATLQTHIETLLGDQKLRSKMQQENLTKAQEFHWSTIYAKYYKQLLTKEK